MSNSKKFSPEVEERLSSYEKSFNPAFVFLSSCAAKPVNGFWLGTKVNAHLYYKDTYFAYIKLTPLALEFNREFNNRIYDGALNKSSRLFGQPLQNLAKKHNLIPRPVSFDGPDIMKTNLGTPLIFFEELKELIQEIYENRYKVS